MGTKRHQGGFTIIEVMMFLAVGGLLTAGIMATSTLSINNQRYKDAVNSFQSLVQGEFARTVQVSNNRPNSTSDNPVNCPGSDSVIAGDRGAAECIIMGRLMTIDGGNIKKYNLVGRAEPSVAMTGRASDIDFILAHSPKIDEQSEEQDIMPWGTTLKGGASASLVILRSPNSGNMYSYIERRALNGAELDGSVGDFGSSPLKRTESYLCIDRKDWTTAPERAVVLLPLAAGPSGVEQRDSEGGECGS